MKNLSVLFFTFLAGVITYLRRPDALHRPQLYAEDGVIWLTQAYEQGLLEIIFRPQDGYYNWLGRFAAAIAMEMSLLDVPRFFAYIAFCIQLLPVAYIFSKRLSHVVPNNYAKALLALVYLTVPNVVGLHVTLANAHWRMAIVTFLIFVAKRPQSVFLRVVDVVLLSLGVMTGPFSVFLLPAALYYLYRVRDRWTSLLTGIVIVGAAFQLHAILGSLSSARPDVEMGISWENFSRIFSGQIVISELLGAEFYRYIFAQSWWSIYATSFVSLTALFLIFYAILNGSDELRIFTYYTFMVVASALYSPTIHADKPAWVTLAEPTAANRYWFSFSIAFIGCLLCCIAQRQRVVKILSTLFLLMLPYGLYAEFRLPGWKKVGYRKAVQRFHAAHSGQLISFPIHPPGYTFRLVKR